MDLYINNTKCSLFGDEEIEITRTWGVDNMLNCYGSYSKSFTIPIDHVNSAILKHYDVIGTVGLNPNYFIDAFIIINEYEIVGNISIVGFQTKKGIPFSYSVVFYGDEKNLINELNSSTIKKLNDIPLGTKYNFSYSKTNITNTWAGTNKSVFVPIMATRRPFSYKSAYDINNINYAATGSVSGITFTDLLPSYNLKQLLDSFFSNYGITLNNSTKIADFLYELYLMPNTKVQNTKKITFINVIAKQDYLYGTVGGGGAGFNILKLSPPGSTSSSVFLNNGILDGTNDLTSWNNITGYTLSTNYFKQTPDKATYNLTLSLNIDTYQPIRTIRLQRLIYDPSLGYPLYSYPTIEQYYPDFNVQFDIFNNQECRFLIDYSYTIYDEEGNPIDTAYTYFRNNELTGTLKLTELETSSGTTFFSKNIINFSDMLFSDFFTNFCKSFNIFYGYNSITKVVNTYFKPELETTTYDLSKYLLLDMDYSYTNSQKYKLIDYKFKEPKDINNLYYKKYAGSDKWFGEFKKIYDYNICAEKKEYTSIFTTIPRTILNKTDAKNNIIETTDIPAHTELSEGYDTLNTDFLLFYKLPTINNAYHYSLQSTAMLYDEMSTVSDYGPTNLGNTYSIDYNYIDMELSNVKQRYETTLEFLLPYSILYNLKVYDKIFVNGICYEIKEFTINIKTGKTKIKCISI